MPGLKHIIDLVAVTFDNGKLKEPSKSSSGAMFTTSIIIQRASILNKHESSCRTYGVEVINEETVLAQELGTVEIRPME